MSEPAIVFSLSNLLILPCWLALATSLFWRPARPALWTATGAVVPALLGLAYLWLIVRGFGETPAGGFGSIVEVRELFASDAALTAGWLHYLAFDLVVGTLIVRQGTAAAVHPLLLLPCLTLTFMLGPVGYLLFLALRRLPGRARSVQA